MHGPVSALSQSSDDRCFLGRNLPEDHVQQISRNIATHKQVGNRLLGIAIASANQHAHGRKGEAPISVSAQRGDGMHCYTS